MGAHASRLKRDVNPAALGRRRGGGFFAILSLIAAFFTITAMDAGGATATLTSVTELEDERGRVLSEIDDLLATAKADGGRALSDEELGKHDQLVARSEELQGKIAEATRDKRTRDAETAQDERLRLASIRTNTIGTPAPGAERSLNELLWATYEEVPAGSIDRMGVFRPNPNGVKAYIDAVPTVNQDGRFVLAPRMEEFIPEHRTAVRAFQRAVADMVMFGFMVDRKAKTTPDAFQAALGEKRMRERWDRVMRAMDVDTTAEGKEFVPTGLGAEMHEKVRASGKVAPLFGVIQLPTNPWEMPIEGADATAFLVAEPTSDTATKVTASTPGTKKTAFDAEIFGARVLFSRSLDADSAIAILAYTEGKIVRAFVDAEEKAILDGDADGTHQDSDVVAATDARQAWDGLRKRALANANVDMANVAITLAKLRDTREAMVKWGLNPADLVIIVGVKGYYQLLDLSEVTTLDKFGPQATILNGQLGAIDGVPLIVSEFVREDLAAAGTHDGVTVNRTYALLVNRGEWALGQRMALDIEVDDSIYRESFQRVVVGFMREDFQNVGDAAANDDTAILRNIA
jgi:HK97 family phage major capsid protein